MEIMLNNIKIGQFKNLNLCIFHNKINVIVGTNGSGKSMLAELIATTQKPKEGIYTIGRERLADVPVGCKTIYVDNKHIFLKILEIL